MKINAKAILLDAKKALGVVAVTIPAAAAAGLIDNAQAATITGVVGAVTAVVVYLLKNVPARAARNMHTDLVAPPTEGA